MKGKWTWGRKRRRDPEDRLLILGRIAPQGDNLTNAIIPPRPRQCVDFRARRADACQMRRRRDRRIRMDAPNDAIGPLPRRPARAISNRKERRLQRRQRFEHGP